MSVFQWLFGAFCLFQACRALATLRRSWHLPNLLSLAVWVAALVMLLKPDLSTYLARLLGIGRGADLVLYVLVLIFMLAHWQHYARYKRLEGNVTTLVREFAVERRSVLPAFDKPHGTFLQKDSEDHFASCDDRDGSYKSSTKIVT